MKEAYSLDEYEKSVVIETVFHSVYLSGTRNLNSCPYSIYHLVKREYFTRNTVDVPDLDDMEEKTGSDHLVNEPLAMMEKVVLKVYRLSQREKFDMLI